MSFLDAGKNTVFWDFLKNVVLLHCISCDSTSSFIPTLTCKLKVQSFH